MGIGQHNRHNRKCHGCSRPSPITSKFFDFHESGQLVEFLKGTASQVEVICIKRQEQWSFLGFMELYMRSSQVFWCDCFNNAVSIWTQILMILGYGVWSCTCHSCFISLATIYQLVRLFSQVTSLHFCCLARETEPHMKFRPDVFLLLSTKVKNLLQSLKLDEKSFVSWWWSQLVVGHGLKIEKRSYLSKHKHIQM